MLKQRLPIRLVAAAGCLLAARLSASSAQDVYKVRTVPAQKPTQPADPAGDAMRREAQARAREHAAQFARLKAIDLGVVGGFQPAAVDERVAARAIVLAQAQELNVAQARQVTAQFRAILKAEYQLLLAACEPTDNQRRKIATAGEKALQGSAAAYADWQRRPNRRIVNGVLVPNSPDVRKAIQLALSAAAAAHLSPAQMVRYSEELKARKQEERQTIVLNLVVKLDERLHLSEDQRAALSEAISKGWSDDWAPSLQTLTNQNRYLPALPDNLFRPILTDGQRQTWDGLQKIQLNSIAGLAIGMLPDPVPLEDAELEDESKPKPK